MFRKLVLPVLLLVFLGAVIVMFFLRGENISGEVIEESIFLEDDLDIDLLERESEIERLRNTDTFFERDGISKEYFHEDKRILMRDVEGEVVLDLKLESDFREVVMAGGDSLVAWFDLNEYSGVDFVDAVKFYDVNDGYREIEKDYSFKYRVFDSKVICDEEEKDCNELIYDRWIEFENLSGLPGGKVRVGLFINIEAGEKIEWVIEKDGFEFLEWAIVEGTNAGFVHVAPTSNPNGVNSDSTTDGRANVIKFLSPSDMDRVTEIGWYLNTVPSSSDCEVGIYAHNSSDNTPTTLISSQTCSVSDTGWQTVSVDIDLDPSTLYWIGIQTDDVAGTIYMDRADVDTTDSMGWITGQNSLPSTWGDFTIRGSSLWPIYALYENTSCNCPTYGDVADTEAFERFSSGSGTVNFDSDWIAQTFTVGTTEQDKDFNISKVILRMRKNFGTNPGTVTVSIRATSSGDPTGGDLSSGTTDGDTLTTSMEERTISMSSYELQASTQYAIVVRAQDTGLRWSRETSGGYSGGDIRDSSNSGSSWNSNYGGDNRFQVWGDDPFPGVIDANWTVNMSEGCNMSSVCDLGTGDLNFEGSGDVNCTAEISAVDVGDPGNGNTLFISDGCILNVG